MLLRDGENYLEVTPVERLMGQHGAGDTQFAVRVRVSGMHALLTADALCWVDLPALTTFAEELRVLEERRQGAAALESMSPGELRLEIRTTDSAGHVAAIGQAGQWLGIGAREPYWSAVAFRVPFCPTELPALIREFSSLTIAPTDAADPAV